MIWVPRTRSTTLYRKIPAISPGPIQLRKGFLIRKREIFRQGSAILDNVVWLHVNNCCTGAVACLYQEAEGGITGGPTTGCAHM